MSVFLFFRKQNYHCNLGKTASAGQSHAARCRGVAILFHQVMNLRWPLQSNAGSSSHCYFKGPGAFRRWGLASRSGPKGRPLKQSPATGFQAEFPVSSFAWMQSCLILLLPRMELLAGICLPPLPCFKLLRSQARIKLPALNHWCQVIWSGWQESN